MYFWRPVYKQSLKSEGTQKVQQNLNKSRNFKTDNTLQGVCYYRGDVHSVVNIFCNVFCMYFAMIKRESSPLEEVFTQGTEGSTTASCPVGKGSNVENRIRGKCHLERESRPKLWVSLSGKYLHPSLHTGQGHHSNASAFTQPQLETMTPQLQPPPSRRDLSELLPLLCEGKKQPLLC